MEKTGEVTKETPVGTSDVDVDTKDPAKLERDFDKQASDLAKQQLKEK